MTSGSQASEAVVYSLIFWRWRWFILLGALICCAASVLVAFYRSQIFEAQATLVLNPALTGSQGRPQSSPAFPASETLRTSLLADTLIQALRGELETRGIETPPNLRSKLRIELVSSDEVLRPGERRLLPVLILKAQGGSSSVATGIVNAWAVVSSRAESSPLLSQRRDESRLMMETRQGTIERLDEVDREAVGKQREMQGETLALERKWSRRKTELSSSSAARLAEYKHQTEVLLSDKRTELEPSRRACEIRLDNLRSEFDALCSRRLEVQAEISRTRVYKASLTGELEKLDQEVARLQKAPLFGSDDSFGDPPSMDGTTVDRPGLSASTDPSSAEVQRLLRQRRDQAIRLQGQEASEASLVEDLARLEERVARLSDRILDTQAELDRLSSREDLTLKQAELDRELSLQTLSASLEAEAALLELEHKQEVELAEYRNRTELERLLGESKALQNDLLAQTEILEESLRQSESGGAAIEVASLATEPAALVSTSPGSAAIVGLAVGLFGSALLAFCFHLVQTFERLAESR